MAEKKPDTQASPDISRLKEIIIDHRTRIYIRQDADVEEAKFRYFNRLNTKKQK